MDYWTMEWTTGTLEWTTAILEWITGRISHAHKMGKAGLGPQACSSPYQCSSSPFQ